MATGNRRRRLLRRKQKARELKARCQRWGIEQQMMEVMTYLSSEWDIRAFDRAVKYLDKHHV